MCISSIIYISNNIPFPETIASKVDFSFQKNLESPSDNLKTRNLVILPAFLMQY